MSEKQSGKKGNTTWIVLLSVVAVAAIVLAVIGFTGQSSLNTEIDGLNAQIDTMNTQIADYTQQKQDAEAAAAEAKAAEEAAAKAAEESAAAEAKAAEEAAAAKAAEEAAAAEAAAKAAEEAAAAEAAAKAAEEAAAAKAAEEAAAAAEAKAAEEAAAAEAAEEAAAAAVAAEAAAAEAAKAAVEPVTVEFWHAMSGGLQDALVALTDKFNAENGMGITVNLTNQGGYNDLSTKLLGAIASDTMPDMAQVYNSWIVDSLDVVVPLDDMIAADFDNYDDILQAYRSEGAEFGKTYTIAFNKSCQVFFYNKTKYEELGLTPPTTWDELAAVSKAYFEGTGKPSFGYDDLYGMLWQYVEQNGGEFIKDGKVLFDTPEGLGAVSFLLDMYAKGYARTAGEDRYLSGPFNNGDIGAYIGSSAGAAYVKPVGFEYGAAPLPMGVKGSAPLAGTNLAMFAKSDAQQKAAWEYIKFLTSTESTVQWAIATGYLPIRTSGYESEAFQAYMEGSEVAQACYAQAAVQSFEHAYPGAQEIRNTMGTEVETAILEGMTAEEALADFAQKAQEILDRQ